MAVTEAQKRAVKKYQAKMEDFKIHAPAGTKERYRAAAEAAGQSMQAYILQAVEDRIAREAATTPGGGGKGPGVSAGGVNPKNTGIK